MATKSAWKVEKPLKKEANTTLTNRIVIKI